MSPDVELVSVPSDFGHGANDGAYYPVGLLSIGTTLKRMSVGAKVNVVDLHHQPEYDPSASIIGISASSALNYRNVLNVAARAKEKGATVVLGGPHATQLADQILCNRQDCVDYIIRGHGELAFAALCDRLGNNRELETVPGLSWRRDGVVIHNDVSSLPWRYDDFLPFDPTLLSCDIASYWNTFRSRINPMVDASFVVFTHFGCGYRELMRDRPHRDGQLARWCSYCSLNESLSARRGEAILAEVIGLLNATHVPAGARVLLKCYGDNVATQHTMLENLACAIEASDEWGNYQLGWTFYAQSSRISERLMQLLVRVGTENLFIGFDSADDDIQLRNGLGTTIRSHQRALDLCRGNGIGIQAGFVLGCAGETESSLTRTLIFAEELALDRGLERINSAVLCVIPGSPAYSLLCEREPWIRKLDLLPTEELQWYWLRHFCPRLGNNPSQGLELLHRAAERLNELNPGPHASMGFTSLTGVQGDVGGMVHR